MVTKKCNQRLHFLRILNNVQVNKGIISLFYKSTVESIINFSNTAWYGKLTCKDKNKLGRIVKKTNKLGAETKAIDSLYQEGVMKQVENIMKDAHHTLHSQYVFLRWGKRQVLPTQRTDMYRKSFVPKSILFFNHLITAQYWMQHNRNWNVMWKSVINLINCMI